MSFANPITKTLDFPNQACLEDLIVDVSNKQNIYNVKPNYLTLDKKLHKKVSKVRTRTLLTSVAPSIKTYHPKFISNSLQDSIFQYMKMVNLQCPEAAFALAWHETGGFTSKLWREGNNCYGMKFDHKLSPDFQLWSVGDKHYKAGWNSWKSCVDAFAEWEKRKRITATTPQAYVQELRRIGYASDPLHGAKVIAHVKRLFAERATL